MDYEMAEKFKNLSRKIPKEWKEKGVKEIDINRQQREKVQKMLYNGGIEYERKGPGGTTIYKEKRKIKDSEKRMFGKMLQSGQFDKKNKEIDQKVNEKIGRAWDGIIRAARARGDLPSQQETRRDYERFMSSVGRKPNK